MDDYGNITVCTSLSSRVVDPVDLGRNWFFTFLEPGSCFLHGADQNPNKCVLKRIKDQVGSLPGFCKTRFSLGSDRCPLVQGCIRIRSITSRTRNAVTHITREVLPLYKA